MQTISLNIETLILVAVWKTPFIFQGCFNVTNRHDNSRHLLFFRCECYLKNKADFQNEFSPQDYQFTHLYNEKSAISLDSGHEFEQALYLLKYALKAALEMLVNDPKHYLVHVDEVASSSLANQARDYMLNKKQDLVDKALGFAVSIDFIATENSSKIAAYGLLKLCDFIKKDNLH